MHLTIEDTRNPNTESGFSYVNSAMSGGSRLNGEPVLYWRASKGPKVKGKAHLDWKGPIRRTPEEAAQDYCDYVNGGSVGATFIPLKRPSANRSPRKRKFQASDELRALRRKARILEDKEKAGLSTAVEDTYLIGERGSAYAVKVGRSTDQEWRPAELQTGNPRELYVIGVIPGGGRKKETELQQKYIKDNVLLEWFTPTPDLFYEFGVDYYTWRKSLQGQIEAPESISA